MHYRVRETGEVKNQGEIRKLHPSTSFPRVWNTELCDFIGIDPILLSPKPEHTNLQGVVSDGVIEDSLGNWVENWKVVDSFSDYTEVIEGETVDGEWVANEEKDFVHVLHTKKEQEDAFLQGILNTKWESLRTQRNELLKESDWMAGSDVVMSDSWKIYRQALRDLPGEVVDINSPIFPTIPE